MTCTRIFFLLYLETPELISIWFNSETDVLNKNVNVCIIKIRTVILTDYDLIVKSHVHRYVAVELMFSTQTIVTRVANWNAVSVS
jgi:hypothetical protein